MVATPVRGDHDVLDILSASCKTTLVKGSRVTHDVIRFQILKGGSVARVALRLLVDLTNQHRHLGPLDTRPISQRNAIVVLRQFPTGYSQAAGRAKAQPLPW